MPCQDTPPPSETDEIENDFVSDDEFLFEIIDNDDISEAQMFEAEGYPDDAVVTFTGHSDAVFCCNLDRTGNVASSGGQDDKAYIWNPTTGTMIFECTDHTDSVISTAFNYDSSLVATADMNGLVQVWDVKNGSKVWNFAATEIRWMEWHRSKNILVAGTADGDCWLWSVLDEETKLFQSYGFGSTCGCLMPDEQRCVVGYDDGSVRFWNLDQTNMLNSLTGSMAHKSSLISVVCHPDNALTLTSSVDGTAKLLKSSNAEVLWNIQCAEEGSDASVESIDFFRSQPLIATGTNSGSLSIYDVPTKVLRLSCNLQAAIVKLICDPVSPMVYAATTDGFIRLYDGRSGNEERKWCGHSSGILDFVLSSDCEKIVSSSEDSTCKVFKIAQS